MSSMALLYQREVGNQEPCFHHQGPQHEGEALSRNTWNDGTRLLGSNHFRCDKLPGELITNRARSVAMINIAVCRLHLRGIIEL